VRDDTYPPSPRCLAPHERLETLDEATRGGRISRIDGYPDERPRRGPPIVEGLRGPGRLGQTMGKGQCTGFSRLGKNEKMGAIFGRNAHVSSPYARPYDRKHNMLPVSIPLTGRGRGSGIPVRDKSQKVAIASSSPHF